MAALAMAWSTPRILRVGSPRSARPRRRASPWTSGSCGGCG